MKNYLFKARVKHDNGYLNINTNVLSMYNETIEEIKQKVINKILDSEKCPLSAIKKLKLIKIL